MGSGDVDLGAAIALLLLGVLLGIPIGWLIALLARQGYTVQRDASGNIISVEKG